MTEGPDCHSIDAHLVSAHKFLKLAHEQLDELIENR